MPGDVAVVSFDIHGLTGDRKGRARYSVGYSLFRVGKVRPELVQPPEDREGFLAPRVAPLEGHASVLFGLDTIPGKYTLRVTVRDRVSGKSAVVAKDIQVAKSEFAFVRTRFTTAAGEPAAPVVVGKQALMLRYALVNVRFDRKTKLPDITVEIRIIDGAGKLVGKVWKARVEPAVKEDLPFIEFLPIPINPPGAGKFKLELKATDNVTGKIATEELHFSK